MKPYINPKDKKEFLRSCYNDAKSILTHISQPKSIRVLDIGCGEGFDTLAYGMLCESVIGFDPSRFMIKSARATKKLFHINNVKFSVADVKEFVHRTKYHLITFHRSLQFIDAPTMILLHCLFLLEDNGHIMVVLPTIDTTSINTGKKVTEEWLEETGVNRTRRALLNFVDKFKLTIIHNECNDKEEVFLIMINHKLINCTETDYHKHHPCTYDNLPTQSEVCTDTS